MLNSILFLSLIMVIIGLIYILIDQKRLLLRLQREVQIIKQNYQFSPPVSNTPEIKLRESTLDKIIKTFQTEHPNILVTHEKQSIEWDFEDSVFAQVLLIFLESLIPTDQITIKTCYQTTLGKIILVSNRYIKQAQFKQTFFDTLFLTVANERQNLIYQVIDKYHANIIISSHPPNQTNIIIEFDIIK